ncbi:uncharacterized protein [Arachis hypogaea]|uniref:uncharacterized protein n=1 Tax=Arachis hypogaea TaxID=3818 RepID=UPI000DECA2E2|nr:uncharacterized protein LOC112742798 [Arachis hypogaea]
MEKGKAIAQSLGVDKNKEVDVDEEYFDEGYDEMIGMISIIPIEYLGEYEGDPEEDYDMEDEEAFSFIRLENEPGYFFRPNEKQMSHLRPLHITTTLSGIKVNKVLIDGGAAISLLPERMLMKVGKHPDDLVPTNVAVIDFSRTSTPSKGLVTLTVKVGSAKRNTVFVVVPSKASYNALLGRDWIHGVGAVPFTVHQSVLLWSKDGKPEVIKVDSNLYVEQLYVDFWMYNPKLKPLNVDRTLNSYNCEGCYLSSEGLSVKLRYPELEFALTGWDFESCSDLDISNICNESNATNPMADLIAEAHCIENRSNVNEVNDSVHSISNIIDFTFDCIYDLEPLGFEKYSVKDDDHYKGDEEKREVESIIDFRDLNNATPKDEYFMPIADMLIDSAAGNEILSFMDGYSRYNQIFIAEDDVSKTTFHCFGALGTYEWVVMSFGLENFGATYQRAMNAIFYEFIGKFMDVYIDDVMVKSISIN